MCEIVFREPCHYGAYKMITSIWRHVKKKHLWCVFKLLLLRTLKQVLPLTALLFKCCSVLIR